jgi:glycine cleavage system H protein
MLGDLVEFDFTVSPGTRIALGQEIGTMEGFKAVTALYSVAEGELLGMSPALDADITAAESDPYGRGWLYRVRGNPDPQSVDVDGYTALLDATIDRLLESRHDSGTSEPENGS